MCVIRHWQTQVQLALFILPHLKDLPYGTDSIMQVQNNRVVRLLSPLKSLCQAQLLIDTVSFPIPQTAMKTLSSVLLHQQHRTAVRLLVILLLSAAEWGLSASASNTASPHLIPHCAQAKHDNSFHIHQQTSSFKDTHFTAFQKNYTFQRELMIFKIGFEL